MKVIWICHFSNPQIRENLHLSVNYLEVFARKLLGKPPRKWEDYAAWISNGIKEFEKFEDIELHVISPHYGMAKRIESFQIDRIHYHFFKPDDDFVFYKAINNLTINLQSEYRGNRKIIKMFIESIKPDIIHMYGAENPYYSITALDIDIKKYPFLLSLQTLMSDPEFKDNYRIKRKNYFFRSGIEKKIIKRVKYIGSTIHKFKIIVWSDINSKAIFLNTILAVEQKIERNNCEKKYDFVFFSASITKNADIAVEAFALVCNKYPKIKLNIIGGMPEPFTSNLKFRIHELGIEKNVFFSGKFSEHKDVLEQIQFSKYALLPLKIDIVSGTIREAIYAGLPVVTTVTAGTPLLNKKRESVLISEQNDIIGMADNMIRLIESPDLCKKLTQNALITANEFYSNNKSTVELINAYKAIINHHNNNIPIPIEIGVDNPDN